MGLKEFNKSFGVTIDIEAEKSAFVQRINQTIFYTIESAPYPDDYENLFRDICYQLGVNGDDLISAANRMNYAHETRVPGLRVLTSDSFMETLRVLIVLYGSVVDGNHGRITESVELAIASASADLGIRWKDGTFYPSGARELDEALIDDNLNWLIAYPKVKERFKTALEHFGKSLTDSTARKDAITNAYSALEMLAQDFLGNKANFDNNSNVLVKALSLSKEYGQVFHYYKIMANEYSSRHAGSDWGSEETESFIYLTGLFIRLISRKS